MKDVLRVVREFQESTQIDLHNDWRRWDKAVRVFPPHLRSSAWGWIVWDVLQPETERRRVSPQDLQWLLNQFRKLDEQQGHLCIPSLCHTKSNSQSVEVPFLADGKAGLKRFSTLQSPEGRFGYDEEDDATERRQEQAQSINQQAWERKGRYVKLLIGLVILLYFGFLYKYVKGKQQACCALDRNNQNLKWLLEKDDSIDGTLVTPVLSEAGSASGVDYNVCKSGTPRSRCSMTCDCLDGVAAEHSCSAWTVPKTVLRRPNQGRTYYDEFVCLRPSDFDGLANGSSSIYGWAAASLDAQSVASGQDAKFNLHSPLFCALPTPLPPIVPGVAPVELPPQFIEKDEQQWYLLPNTSSRLLYTFRVVVGSSSQRDWVDDSVVCAYNDDGLHSPAFRQLADGTGKLRNIRICNDDVPGASLAGQAVRGTDKRIISELVLRGDNLSWVCPTCLKYVPSCLPRPVAIYLL
eukprot:SAG31_NODE_3735_length_3938_cov_1.264913_1_plen_464_part_00